MLRVFARIRDGNLIMKNQMEQSINHSLGTDILQWSGVFRVSAPHGQHL